MNIGYTRHIRKFNLRLILHVTGLLLLVMACVMVLPLAASLYYHDGAQFGLMLAAVVMLSVALLFRNILGHDPDYAVSERESFWFTAVLWGIVPLTGAIPYLFTGTMDSFTDAIFESVSGFTTTGSSVLRGRLTSVSESVLVWRSITQLIGGLGLVLFVIANLRKLHIGSLQLYDSEFSGTVQRKLHPHIAISVRRMWITYFLATAVLFALLLLCGNNVLEAFTVAVSTISTGGFMTSDAGLTHFSSLSISIVTLFMFLSGINIALLYQLITGKGRNLWRDQEFRTYTGIYLLMASVFVATFMLQGHSWRATIPYVLFHTASTMSTCGLYMDSPAKLPILVCAFTIILMIIGASAGSTGGGIKWKRVIALAQYVHNYFVGMLHPHAVRTVKIDNFVISKAYLNKILAFVFLFIFFLIIGTFLLIVCGYSLTTSFCVAAANISNLGPSPIIAEMGNAVNYSTMPLMAKWTLMILMLLGRVEIFALVAIFSPAYWKRG